ncbi:MAG: hypothetical protein ACTSU5_17545 [Promethearchaeota archaeon]
MTIWGENAIHAIIYRIGQKPGELIAKNILKKYGKSEEDPLENPSAAFSLLENSLEHLFKVEVVEQVDNEKETIVRIKNSCFLRPTVKDRKDLKYGGVLCRFAAGYFENAMKVLTGMDVEYVHKDADEDWCSIDIRVRKKPLV